MKLKIIFMQEKSFLGQYSLVFKLLVMLLRSSMPFLLLTFSFSEVLEWQDVSVCHYLLCCGVEMYILHFHKNFVFLSDFFPFSLFSLEFSLNPAPDKWLIPERTGLIICFSSLFSHIFFLSYFLRDFYLSALLWNCS